VQTVVETSFFIRDAKAVGISDDERFQIIQFIAENPDAGTPIPGTGGARKIRFSGKGKGKSGGYRVVSFYSGENIPVFLLNVFAKNEKMNLSQAERNQLKVVLGSLVGAYKRK
jgi:hypothetical protein